MNGNGLISILLTILVVVIIIWLIGAFI